MQQPTISVIIPTYNYAHYIEEAVNSILRQTYPLEKIEIIVVDDGSTDNTKQVLQPFIEKNEIAYYWQENRGKANATSAAIKKCTSKYIFNLDADDYFFPDKIAAAVKIFESDESIVHVGAPATYTNQETGVTAIENIPPDLLGKPLDGDRLLDRFYTDNILFGGGSTYAARTSALKKINIPDGVDMFIDEFLILALLPFGKSYFTEQSLSAWRMHTSNYSGSAANYEKQVTKEKRLLKSSAAVLSYITENGFNKKLIKIYRLKDATMKISFKETIRNKKYSDIIKYSSEVFFKLKPNWKVMMNYHVMNRLIPSGLFRFLKKIKKNQFKSVSNSIIF
jgi:glycosyltransferase involved in cell wall biosynthesis